MRHGKGSGPLTGGRGERRAPRRLVLFDIDGTLLSAGGLGGSAMLRALEARVGRPIDATGYQYGGRTDPEIIRDLMTRAGVPVAEIERLLPDILADYVVEFARLLRGSTRPRLHPGVRELLVDLDRDPTVLVGLLTGNIEAGARLKLDHFGIRHYFRLGAYGSDDEDRNALVAVALERAQAAIGVAFVPEQVRIIGDTPRDIECARRAGAVAVAVATGRHTLEELARHAPDLLLPDLSATGRVMAGLRDRG